MYILTRRLYKGVLNALDLVPPVLIPGLTVLNAVTAHASIDLGCWSNEADQMLFSIGIVYVMVFFVIITYRLVHLEPLVLFLKPTLLLMSAPFEISFLSYLSTKTQVNAFAAMLFYFGFFIIILPLTSMLEQIIATEMGAEYKSGGPSNKQSTYSTTKSTTKLYPPLDNLI